MTRSRCLSLLLLAASVAAAQSPDKTQPSNISPDAQAYLNQAAQSILQRTAGNPPFHLKATFSARAAQGNAAVLGQTGDGTYEEIWKSPSEWRKEIIFGSFHRITGRNGDQKIWIVQTPPDQTPFAISQLGQLILPTFPAATDALSDKWNMSTVMIGKSELVRVGNEKSPPKNGKREIPEGAYYFVPDSHILLLHALGMDATQFTRVAKLGDKAVLMSGTYISPFFVNLSFTIDSLTENPKIDAALLTPPADAKFLEAGATISSTLIRARCIRCPHPEYPELAKLHHVSGTVVVQALIDTTGAVTTVKVLAGPALLQGAALDAVKQFQYVPTTQDGVPVSVTTMINVVFTEGH
jgi:TonB family protein